MFVNFFSKGMILMLCLQNSLFHKQQLFGCENKFLKEFLRKSTFELYAREYMFVIIKELYIEIKSSIKQKKKIDHIGTY